LIGTRQLKAILGAVSPSGFDRLPALAGLAKALAERTGDEYLAGIWKKGLIEGLLWYGEDDLLLTPTYRAPSWSWASVDGFYQLHSL